MPAATISEPRGRRWIAVLCAAILTPAAASAADPERSRRIMPAEGTSARRALVIGNDSYRHLPPLANAVHDARAMKGVLEELDFEVQLIADAGAADLHRAVSAFAGGLRPGDVGLFYYSGHGLQIQGENFLIPVDFDAANEIDARFASYPAEKALQSFERSGAELNILILDACRDNPFSRTRSGVQGLAIMNAGRGTLIAFATGPGRTASDGRQGSGGLFTRHLIDKLRAPGLSLDQVFNRVALAVDTDSGGRQTPWVVKSLMGDVYLRSPASGNDNGSGDVIERAFWDSVNHSGKAEELRAYLRHYPRGRFADLARIRLRDFAAAATDTAADEPRCAPAAECTRLGYRQQSRGGAGDLPLAAVYHRQGCDLGDARGCVNLGVMYEKGQGVYADDVKAAELYQEGCERGDALGCTYLGFMYQGGRGVLKSPVKAYELLRLGCEGPPGGGQAQHRPGGGQAQHRSGGGQAQHRPGGGQVEHRSGGGQAQHRPEGGQTGLGHAAACTHLGILYETGEGVAAGPGRAGRYYAQGCAGRHAPGCRRLGLLYEQGLGVAADPMQAVELYRLACDGEDAPACTSLGLLHSQGRGVARDRAAAASLYRQGCGHGDERGCENLQVLCRERMFVACR